MTDFQKNIYNTWLRITRSKLNKPYRLRKNFDSLDGDSLKLLNRLEAFFKRNKTIDLEEFFVAPLCVYNDNNNVPLSFYISMKAINIYKLYKKHIEKQNN